jgi:hypothetical protein
MTPTEEATAKMAAIMSATFTPGPCTSIRDHHRPGGWRHGYVPAFPWGSTTIQWGGPGSGGAEDRLPPRRDGKPRHAFFEAFNEVTPYIRAEGATVAEAEAKAWKRLQQVIACPGHEFERMEGYDNGMARCTHCRVSGCVLPPTTRCFICDEPSYYGERQRPGHSDGELVWYCEEHMPKVRPGHPWYEMIANQERWMEKPQQERDAAIVESLPKVLAALAAAGEE